MADMPAQATPDKIVIILDIEPLLAFELMGLALLSDIDDMPPQNEPS